MIGETSAFQPDPTARLESEPPLDWEGDAWDGKSGGKFSDSNPGIAHGADLGGGAWRPSRVAARQIAARGRGLPRLSLSDRCGPRGGPAPADLAGWLHGRRAAGRATLRAGR